jgi:hypothetical protein
MREASLRLVPTLPMGSRASWPSTARPRSQEIVEPMLGSAGVFASPQGYLQRLRDITRAHGILLIFNEVITGFGRLGYPFAAERYGIVPDMICFAKAVTNGARPARWRSGAEPHSCSLHARS